MANMHLGRKVSRIGVLSAMFAVLVTGVVVASPTPVSRAVTCGASDASLPELVDVGSDDYVMSEASASCTSPVYRELEVSVRRLRTAWPDAVVAVQRSLGTAQSWYAKAQGCEPAASGAQHDYKGVRKFDGVSDDHSDGIGLTCFND